MMMIMRWPARVEPLGPHNQLIGHQRPTELRVVLTSNTPKVGRLVVGGNKTGLFV